MDLSPTQEKVSYSSPSFGQINESEASTQKILVEMCHAYTRETEMSVQPWKDIEKEPHVGHVQTNKLLDILI